nr:MAG TPA: hypothetical protein [Caudoviricetes sp.]
MRIGKRGDASPHYNGNDPSVRYARLLIRSQLSAAIA